MQLSYEMKRAALSFRPYRVCSTYDDLQLR